MSATAERLPDYAVTHANVAIVKTDDGRIAAGVELCKRTKTEDGRTLYTPYHVISWIRDDLRTPTINQAITAVLTEAVAAVDHESKIVIFCSFNKAFQKNNRSLRFINEVQMLSERKDLTVKVSHRPRLAYIQPNHPMMLGEDALRRGYTISMPV